MKKLVSVAIVLAMAILCVMPTLCVNAANENGYKQTFECENYTDNFCEVIDCTSASNGKAVKGVGNVNGNPGEWCRIVIDGIEVPAEGEYDIDIYYSCKEERTFRLCTLAEVGDGSWLSIDDDTLYKVSTGDDNKFEKITITKTLTDEDRDDGDSIMLYSLYELPAEYGGGDENDTQWAPIFDKVVIRAKGVPSDDEDNKGDNTGDNKGDNDNEGNNNEGNNGGTADDNKDNKPVKTGDVSAVLAIVAAGAAAFGGLKLRKNRV